MNVPDSAFLDEFVGVWDDGAKRDPAFITTGVMAILPDYYGDIAAIPPPFPVTPGERVLDLGCGWGRMLNNVCALGANAVGMDISSDMLAAARGYINTNKRNASFVRGDGTRLPFADNSFDTVYSLLVLQYLSKENGRAVFREIHRVLKPGGHAHVWVPGRFAPENLLFAFLQFVSIHLFRHKDPIRMRFYRIGEARRMCAGLFSSFDATGHEFRPPWNLHTKWTWHKILIPRRFHKGLRRISDRIENAANSRFRFLRRFGVVTIVRVVK